MQDPLLEELGGADRDAAAEFRQSLADALGLLRRRWLVVLAVAVVVVAAGVAFTLRQPKIYEARVVVVLEQTQIRPLGREVESLEQSPNFWMGQREFRITQLNFMRSRPVLEQVVREFDLENDLDFLDLAELPPEELEAARARQDPIKTLLKRTTADVIRESHLAEVRVEDRNPERAARLANALVRAYSDRRRQAKTEVTASAAGWLDEQVANLRSKLDETESRMDKFQAENDIRATSFESHSKLVSERQSKLSGELLGMQRKQWELASKQRMIDGLGTSPTGVLSSPLAEGNPVLQQLSSKLLELGTRQQTLAARYGPDHPSLIEATSALTSAKSELSAELARITDRIKLRKAEVDRVVSRIERALAEARQQAFELNGKTMAYQRLEYEIENSRTLYAIVLRRSKETQIGEMTQFADVEIMEPAEVPTAPIRPRKRLNVLFSLILGLIAGIAGAFLVEALDTRVKGVEDAETIVGRPHMGSVAEIGAKELDAKVTGLKGDRKAAYDALDDRRRIELFPYYFPKSNTAESVRLIRTNLRFLMSRAEGNVWLVTSANPQEGKSTIVNYLGHSLAAAGDKRVLIIDSDLHRPMQHKAYGLENKKGLSNLLIGSNPIDDVVQHTDVENVHVITSGPTPPNSAELLGHPQLKSVLDELSQRYDEVILDSPPVLALSDALVLSSMVSGVVLVVRPDATDRGGLKHLVRQLQSIQAPVVGFLFNHVRPPTRAGYYKYGRYGDYYHHQYYGRYAMSGQYGYSQEGAGDG